MQTMLRMIGYGDNAGSGFPTILATWESEGWIEPKLIEDADLNQVTLVLQMTKKENKNVIENVIEISEEKIHELIPEYSKKKVKRAYSIVKIILEDKYVSIDEMKNILNVTDRTMFIVG